MTTTPFPQLVSGTVVHGFGRGSKELGCPTANLDDSAVEKLSDFISQGVYYGWAQVVQGNNSPVFKTAASVGTNPFYHGTKKTIEAHIMHTFPNDFYGEKLKIILLGEIRKMTTFKSADELVAAIQSDIATADEKLDTDECLLYRNHSFFID